MKKIMTMSLLLVLMLTIFTGCKKENTQVDGSNDASLTTILDKKKLILGLDKSFPPMGFENDNQEIVGFDIDVAKEVANRMGIELVIQPISWKAKELELSTKNIDCIWNGMSYNKQRDEELTLTSAYMKNSQVAVVLASSSINKIGDLAGKTVIIQNGSTASDAMDEDLELKNSLKELILVEDNVQALLDLKTSGSDAVVLDEVVARYYVEKEEGTYRILDDVLAEEDYVIGFRKGEVALANEVENQLKSMAADGTLAKLSEAWFGKDLTTIK